MPFELPDIPTDPDDVTVRVLDALAENLEGWEPVEGAPEVALAEEIGRETAATNARAATAILTAVAGIGETVFGLTVAPETPAMIPVEITVTAIGDVIPADLLLIGTTGTGVEVAFTLPEAITAESTTVASVATAADAGAQGHVPAGPLVVATGTVTVVSATATGPSTGGTDAETVAEYVARFADYASILRPGGVRGRDLAALARSVPGVHRALGLDLYDADTGATDAERTATIVAIDVDGLPVAGDVAAAVAAQLVDVREVNFVIRTTDPTYTTLDVAYTAVAETGYAPATVAANVDAAIGGWLSPGRWGNGDGASSPDVTIDADQVWTETLTVRYLDLARVAGTAEGVAYLTSITMNGASADVTLGGPAALPAPFTAPPVGVTASSVAGVVE